jgi:hypothetical protein
VQRVILQWHIARKNLGKEKIYISPPNYHHFSGWPLKLPRLVLRPPKLPTPHFLAPSVCLCRLNGWKWVMCTTREFLSPNNPKIPLCLHLKFILYFLFLVFHSFAAGRHPSRRWHHSTSPSGSSSRSFPHMSATPSNTAAQRTLQNPRGFDT